MPYKSKRTRDLQGEVVAGSGITITEQTKPDGTKEYTITNGDPASAITVDGTGLSLIANVLRNTMAQSLGWVDRAAGVTEKINWVDDNNDPFLQLKPFEKVFIGDASIGGNFFLCQEASTDPKLIGEDVEISKPSIAESSGVTLGKLADMVNSAAQYQFTMAQVIYSGTPLFYNNYISELIAAQGEYYNEIDVTYNGYTIKAIQVKQAGVYELSARVELRISTTNTPTLDVCRMLLGRYDNQSGFSWDVVVCGVAQQCDTNDYAVIFTWSGLIEASAMECFSITGELGAFAGVIDDISTLDYDPFFSIRKVR